MESFPKADETFPTLPPYFTPGERERNQNIRIYHIHSSFSPQPPPLLSPDGSCLNKEQSNGPDLTLPPSPPRSRFVSYETELQHSPGPTTCHSCQVQVTTCVTYCIGTYAWLMCLVFVVCGLVLGCCLIPFFVKYFKDAYHTCPHCCRVLHIHRKTCC